MGETHTRLRKVTSRIRRGVNNAGWLIVPNYR
jgi:hypothetical protein